MRAAAITALVVLGGPAFGWAQAAPSGAAALEVTGYADFGYHAGERPGPDGFLGGALLGTAEYAAADDWTLFAEIGARARPDGLDLSVERIAVRWRPRDALTVSVGRLHTPLSYWTAAYAPGSWNRTSLSVPAIADPATGLLPIHAVGIRADGRVPVGPIELALSAAYANGRDVALSGPGDAGDIDGYRAWALAAEARPDGLRALRVGGAVYGDRPLTSAGIEVPERIVAAHAAWAGETSELVAEYVRIRHDDPLLDEARVSRSYYVQLAYRLPERYGRVKPYLRLERFDAAEADPLHAAGDPGLRATVFGVRYDFLSSGALKAEFRSERRPGTDRYRSLDLEAGFRLARREPPLPLAALPPAPAPDTAGPTATKAANAAADTEPARRPSRTPDRSRRAAAPPRAPERRVAPVAIVVHPSTPVTDVTLPELRRIFRGEQSVWPGDERVVLLVRSPLPSERDIVLGQIYQMEETQFRQFWLGKIFRDATASGPKVVADIDTARRLVAALPGAISFLPAAEVGPGLRVLRIDGKLPGEPGYPLQ